MRLNFLCQHHRRSFIEDPEAARKLWFESFDRLSCQAPVATPYGVNLAGSALECAGIYLLAHPQCDAELLERYAASALTLIEMLVTLRQSRLALIVVSGANALVEHLAKEGANREAALDAARRITLKGMHLIESPRMETRADKRPLRTVQLALDAAPSAAATIH